MERAFGPSSRAMAWARARFPNFAELKKKEKTWSRSDFLHQSVLWIKNKNGFGILEIKTIWAILRLQVIKVVVFLHTYWLSRSLLEIFLLGPVLGSDRME
jgi:hypothetical protein